MSPAQELAAAIVEGLAVTAEQFGKVFQAEDRARLEAGIAAAIQQVADEQSQQTDAQVFVDDYGASADLTVSPEMPPLGITVTWGPLLPPSGGRN